MTTTPERRTATLSELVAEEIRALMGRRRMSQAQLARGIGKTEMWVSLRLRGKQPIDMNDLHLIATALGVGVHDLLPPPEIAAAAVTAEATGGLKKILVRPAPSERSDVVRPGTPRPTGQVPRGVTRPGSIVPPSRRRPVSVRPAGRPMVA